jgi:hypothetical protein
MSLEPSQEKSLVAQPTYEYYMVQVPSNFAAQQGQTSGNEIASYVQEWANKLAAQGWEFYRIDSMSMTETPGCLGGLLGGGNSYTQYSIMTFRRQKG